MAAKKLGLRAINNSVLFQFQDEEATLNDGRKTARGFKETTKSGIIYVSSKASASDARWGTVLAVGPEVTEVEVGDRILIEPLKWTEEANFEDLRFWRTTEEFIIAVQE